MPIATFLRQKKGQHTTINTNFLGNRSRDERNLGEPPLLKEKEVYARV
jgi:hypothetical protein